MIWTLGSGNFGTFAGYAAARERRSRCQSLAYNTNQNVFANNWMGSGSCSEGRPNRIG